MSTSKNQLKYLWNVVFTDGTSLRQNPEDRYSKHDESADYNPSAFRDVVDRLDEVTLFQVAGIVVNLKDGTFYTEGDFDSGIDFSLESEPLTERKLIFYREMRQEFNPQSDEVGEPYVHRYAVGYEGKNSEGKVEKKVVYIS